MVTRSHLLSFVVTRDHLLSIVHGHLCSPVRTFGPYLMNHKMFTPKNFQQATSKLPFASTSKRVFLEGRTGPMARFTNGKNRGSKYKNFVFPNHDIEQVRYSLMTCSYARNSVWRKQNRAWKSQGFLLQIAYLSHFPQTTLTIRKTCVSKSRRIER